MFVWTPLPTTVRAPAMQVARDLLEGAGVAVAPGVTFGPSGEGYVRFGLVETETRLQQAAARIGTFLRGYGS